MKRIITTSVMTMVDEETGAATHQISVNDEDNLQADKGDEAMADVLRDLALALVNSVEKNFPAADEQVVPLKKPAKKTAAKKPGTRR